jgi:hypothetical protein
MLSAAVILLLNECTLLRVSGAAGSFPLFQQRGGAVSVKKSAGDKTPAIYYRAQSQAGSHIIKKYYTMSSDQDDLISSGNRLIKA